MTLEKLKLAKQIDSAIYHLTEVRKKYAYNISEFNKTSQFASFDPPDDTFVSSAVMAGATLVDKMLSDEIERLRNEFNNI